MEDDREQDRIRSVERSRRIDDIREQRRRNVICGISFRMEISRYVIDILESKSYQFVKNLGNGSFGDVVLMRKPVTRKEVALKIVTSDRLSENEISLWPRLKHPHIMRLQQIMVINSAEACVFEMEPQECSMFHRVNSNGFRTDPLSIQKLRIWFIHILSGLQYLHSKKLCHLDLKLDNVLISSQQTAAICDFTFINTSVIPATIYGIPLLFRPPEACISRGSQIPVEGVPADMWTMGILVIMSLTGNTIMRKIARRPPSWTLYTYPALYTILQSEKLKRYIQKTLPGSQVTDRDVSYIRNFITMFLKLDPDKRAQTELALTHKFLARGIYMSPSDVIWLTKVSRARIDVFVSSYHGRLSTRIYPDPIPMELSPRESDTPVVEISSVDLGEELPVIQGREEPLTTSENVNESETDPGGVGSVPKTSEENVSEIPPVSGGKLLSTTDPVTGVMDKNIFDVINIENSEENFPLEYVTCEEQMQPAPLPAILETDKTVDSVPKTSEENASEIPPVAGEELLNTSDSVTGMMNKNISDVINIENSEESFPLEYMTCEEQMQSVPLPAVSETYETVGSVPKTSDGNVSEIPPIAGEELLSTSHSVTEMMDKNISGVITIENSEESFPLEYVTCKKQMQLVSLPAASETDADPLPDITLQHTVTDGDRNFPSESLELVEAQQEELVKDSDEQQDNSEAEKESESKTDVSGQPQNSAEASASPSSQEVTSNNKTEKIDDPLKDDENPNREDSNNEPLELQHQDDVENAKDAEPLSITFQLSVTDGGCNVPSESLEMVEVQQEEPVKDTGEQQDESGAAKESELKKDVSGQPQNSAEASPSLQQVASDIKGENVDVPLKDDENTNGEDSNKEPLELQHQDDVGNAKGTKKKTKGLRRLLHWFQKRSRSMFACRSKTTDDH